MQIDPIDDGIDIGALLSRIRHGWPWIVGAVIAGLTLAAIYLHVATYKYTTDMRVTPVQGSGNEGLSSKLGQLGGLAAAAGVALPDSPGGGGFKLYVEALQSRDVSDRLILNRALVRAAFPREWNERARRWEKPTGALQGVTQPLKNLLGVPTYAWRPPNSARLQEFLQKNLVIDQSTKTPVVTIMIKDKDPRFGKQLLTALNTTVDGLLRERAILRADSYIGYLTGKLATITYQEQRIAIIAALGEQERIRMAASSNRPFAAEVFQAPAVSDRPTDPVPVKVLLIALLLSLAVGIALALLRRPQPAGFAGDGAETD